MFKFCLDSINSENLENIKTQDGQLFLYNRGTIRIVNNEKVQITYFDSSSLSINLSIKQLNFAQAQDIVETDNFLYITIGADTLNDVESSNIKYLFRIQKKEGVVEQILRNVVITKLIDILGDSVFVLNTLKIRDAGESFLIETPTKVITMNNIGNVAHIYDVNRELNSCTILNNNEISYFMRMNDSLSVYRHNFRTGRISAQSINISGIYIYAYYQDINYLGYIYNNVNDPKKVYFCYDSRDTFISNIFSKNLLLGNYRSPFDARRILFFKEVL